MGLPINSPAVYVNSLLLCGPLEDTTSWATESLLNFLADQGYKVFRE
jgi:hypothetical protein